MDLGPGNYLRLYDGYDPNVVSTCTGDSPTWVDSYSDNCAGYAEYPSWCDEAASYAVDGVDATTMCCVTCNESPYGTLLAEFTGSVPPPTDSIPLTGSSLYVEFTTAESSSSSSDFTGFEAFFLPVSE